MRNLRTAPLAVLGAVAVVVLLVVLGSAEALVVPAVLFLLCVLALRSPLLLVVPVLAAMYGDWRIGGAALDLSVADAALLVAALAALPFLRLDGPKLRRCFAGVLAYQALLALVVVSHPTRRAILEWNHRLLLVAGAMAVGAVVARYRRSRAAIGGFLAASAVVAVAAGVNTVTTGFAPAYPFGFHKNAAGLLLTFAFLATVVAPRVSAVPSALVLPLRGLLLAGILATQSRGSMLALIAGLTVHALRQPGAIRRLPVVVIAVVAMGMVVFTVNEQQAELIRENPNNARFIGAGARQEAEDRGIDVWSDHPMLGGGLRYFKDAAETAGEPHSVLVVSVAEGGLVGLFGLAVLLGVAWLALRRVPGEIAVLARLVLGVRLLAALFDIYWVAGRGSLPWVLIGMALGAKAERRVERPHAVATS